MATVLVVDDEKPIADLVEVYLTNEGFDVLKAYDGATALACVESTPVDAAVLDVMLPDISGFELCRRIRETKLFPIVMLTARVTDADKINGLTLGADDYMTKPFSPLELVARVKSQLRRQLRYDGQNPAPQAGGAPEEYDFMGLIINNTSHKATLYGRPLDLTPTEFAILWYLCDHRGAVVSNEELYEAVWGETYFESSSNTVMAHIARLRSKMGETARKPRIIQTVWGVGYTVEQS